MTQEQAQWAICPSCIAPTSFWSSAFFLPPELHPRRSAMRAPSHHIVVHVSGVSQARPYDSLVSAAVHKSQSLRFGSTLTKPNMRSFTKCGRTPQITR